MVSTVVPTAAPLRVTSPARPARAWVPRQPLTAVVSSFERPARLEACLRSFFEHHPNWFCVVGDVSRQPVALKFDHPHLKVVRRTVDDQVANLSAARNLALAEVCTPHFALMDDDTVLPSPEPLESLYRECVSRHAHVCAGDVQQDGRHNRFEGVFREEFGGLRILPVAGKGPVHAFKNFFVGETAFVRRLGWDEDFPIQEHLDFLIRFHRAGGEAWYLHSAVAVHERGAEGADYDGFRRRSGYHAQTLAKFGFDWVAYANGNILRDDEFAPAPESTCVVVLTTGRSGSSCVAQMLHELGCNMGDQLAHPHPGEAHVNPTYCEPLDLLPAGWGWSSAVAGDWAFERVRDHASRMRLRCSLFGIKLPGFAHNPNLAVAAIASAGVERIKFVHSARGLDESVKSLVKTGWQTSSDRARDHLGFRSKSIQEFLGNVPATNQHTIEFDRLKRSPETEAARLAEFIGQTDSELIQSAAEIVVANEMRS